MELGGFLDIFMVSIGILSGNLEIDLIMNGNFFFLRILVRDGKI